MCDNRKISSKHTQCTRGAHSKSTTMLTTTTEAPLIRDVCMQHSQLLIFVLYNCSCCVCVCVCSSVGVVVVVVVIAVDGIHSGMVYSVLHNVCAWAYHFISMV